MDDQTLRNWPLDKLKFIHLEMGMQCNVRCSMCYQTDFSPNSRLSDAIWKEKMRPAYQTADYLVIVGGEPTVIPSCRELVKLVTSEYPNLTLDMATNGLLFNGFWADMFLEHGHCINFSIHTTKPDLYPRIVQFGNLQKVIENIDHVVQRKVETGSSLQIRTSVVVTNDTVLQIPDFILWSAEHGLDQVLIMTDQLGKFQDIPQAQVRDSIERAYQIADANPQIEVISLGDFDWYYASLHGLDSVRPRTSGSARRAPCPTAFDGIYVNDDGSAKPCCRSWYLYGNLNRQTLQEIWNSEAAYRFRRRMLKMDFRDCTVACDLNANPIDHRIAFLRKAYWVFRRNPRNALKKGMRKLGLTTAQIKKRDS
ncbi:radical SAM protein [candidate division KSB1 bacterium]|nr:MAG: radical SAM protein [candidate division KSB1 bacterium]